MDRKRGGGRERNSHKPREARETSFPKGLSSYLSSGCSPHICAAPLHSVISLRNACTMIWEDPRQTGLTFGTYSFFCLSRFVSSISVLPGRADSFMQRARWCGTRGQTSFSAYFALGLSDWSWVLCRKLVRTPDENRVPCCILWEPRGQG